MPEDNYRPLPPAIRRFNEIAQFVGSLSLIASVAVIGFFFFFGSEDTAGYRFDRKHGWALLGDRADPDSFEFGLLPNDPSPRIDKDVVVRKKEGGVFLRPEPYYPFYSVIGTRLGFDRDAGVKGYVPEGTCARVNAITKTGLDSLWIHITIVDDSACGGPRSEPKPEPDPSPAQEPTEEPAMSGESVEASPDPKP
jgi:hypothetical protein